MGYRIDYLGPTPKQQARTCSTARLRTMAAAAFLAFSIAVRAFWPEGTDLLQSAFLPAELSVTEQAFSQLVEDLRHGQPLDGCVTAFCRTVLDEQT